MGLGDKLLNSNYIPQDTAHSTIETPYFAKKIVKCPVKHTADIIEYAESKEYLGIKLRALQRKFLEELFSKVGDKNKFDQGVLCAGMRGGKCVQIDQNILMFDGTLKKAKDIKVGDLVMGPDSISRTVLETSRGASELFEIHQSQADNYTVNEYHILSLKKTQSARDDRSNRQPNGRYPNEPDVVNISIKDYLKKSDKWKYFFRGYKAGLITFSEQPVPIDPYLIGVWLGDGFSKQPIITSADIEIVQWLEDYCAKNNLKLSISDKRNNKSANYRLCKTSGLLNPLWEEFKKLSLVSNKHIPQCYISNSKEIRLEVLAGIIDTDGHHRADRHGYDIALSNEQLANDVKRLADTLGYRTHIQKKKTTCQVEGYEGTTWRISIYGDVWEIPCKIKYKQYIHNGKQSNRENYLSSIKVESIGEGEYAGIGVDKDNLFCLADGTVTHNSYIAAVIMTYMTQYMLQFPDPAVEFGLEPSRLTGQCIASSEIQAKETVFAHIESIIDKKNWWVKYFAYLKEREANEGKHTLFQRLKQAVEFPERRLAMLSLHSNSSALAGKTSYCVVLDELSRFDVVEGAVAAKSQTRSANAVYSTVSRSVSNLKKVSKIVVISSPMFEDDYTMQLLAMSGTCYVGAQSVVVGAMREKMDRKVPNLYGMHATTFELSPKTEANPSGFIEGEDFESERIQNPETYRRDYLAIPPATINPFFEFPERIDKVLTEGDALVLFSEKMIEEQLQTDEGIVFRIYIGKKALPLAQDQINKYYVCVDQGEKRDHFTLAMGHIEESPVKVGEKDGVDKESVRLKVVIDLITGWAPDPENRITVSFSNVEEVIKLICDNFNVGKVGYDRWSSVESIQRLFSEGIYVEQVGANLEMYEVLKQLIYQGQIELPKQCPDYETLIHELKQLTLIKGKRLDHPPQGSKDYADAVCRVCWFCYEDYIRQTVHGQHILPHKISLPTIKSIASAYEVMQQAEHNPHGAIWGQAPLGGMSISGEGVFGETIVVRKNVLPNLNKRKM